MIDAVVPARNEAATVAAVVAACRACRYTSEVIVVDDSSSDGTGDLALVAGAKVVRLEPGAGGSKAAALGAGIEASGADAFLFCDADCIGLTGEHLDEVCRPFVQRRAAMSIGMFDYGSFWNPQVLRWPPTSGQRVIARAVWDAIPLAKRRGYDIEIMINEVIAEGRLPTTVLIMSGVTQRTKRDKYGLARGLWESQRMFWHLIALPFRGVVRFRTYWFYLRALTILDVPPPSPAAGGRPGRRPGRHP